MFRLSLVCGLGLACLVFLVASGSSQDEKKGKIKGMLPPGWKALKLSTEQKLKVYAIQGDFRAKIDKLEVQIRELKTQEKAEMAKVLSEDQKALLRKLTVGDEGAKEKKGASKEKVVLPKDGKKEEKK